MVKLPLCFEAGSAASVFRQVLDDMGLTYSRQDGTRSYTRFAAVVALEQSAYSYKYNIQNPNINFEIWSEVPGLSGNITYLGFNTESNSHLQKILQNYVDNLPRNPWLFSLSQKLRNGFLSPGIYGAKKKWKEFL
ncbi:MAG: hypothetical protein BEU04_00770 [Marine Group III euryarchaeote CG-Bathy1]|uniref:Uncharacterized protein n=1 Tax=Marine Group III euryarchaeote CG-Bathy1 TaxID=1889001 RepID=A0A1J5THB6_9ARCH|nr:MAG: hypothetical protein BEU04_00770 [Marine Group III euryarchaeote CG-Bathy1]